MEPVYASQCGVLPISTLVQALKPRYHFSAAEQVFFERPPYRNAKVLSAPMHITRFIGLAMVGNKPKHKV